jgi:hypothetical protein
VTDFRGNWHFDGGLTDFIPEPDNVGRVYRATCFPLTVREGCIDAVVREQSIFCPWKLFILISTTSITPVF